MGRKPWKSIPLFALFASTIAINHSQAWGQGNASTAIAQLATVFSAGQTVQQIQMSGTATWYAGGLEDSGTVTLTATSDGSSQMQLALASTGAKTESQTGSGESALCQWAGSDGVSHPIASNNCWKPSLWFLPAFSLQPSLLPSQLQLTDLGSGAVGFEGNIYRHLQGQLIYGDLPDPLSTEIADQSVADLGLDPSTMLPAVFAYSVLPDSGTPTPIAIEIHYTNYQPISGVQIPFLIQRYVNGSLQLAITLSSAQIN